MSVADSVRIRRVAEEIRGQLSEILREEVRDPRLNMVTITRVKLASDLGAATIFYSPLGEDPTADRARELNEAMLAVTGFVRRSLSKRVKLRHTPNLRFILDDSIAEGSQTLSLIRSLDVQPEEEISESGEVSTDPSGEDHGEI
ncbi:MAG TPA: 30S ribosome-binding factor RbfA [Myxococcales bacterium]|nr:30S ribosome-binding factor RbfA [Myxococcales bacterium]HIK83876.1 30S ribosome-binding factor RbfA [Myxococcales bacterium]